MRTFTLRQAARILLAVLLVAVLLSCASKPKAPEQPTPPQEVPEQKAPEQKAPEQKAPEEKPPEVIQTPEEVPEEVQPVEPQPVEAVKQVEPLSNEEIAQARQAIARAEEADADYFAPDLMKQARQALNRALLLRASDPDAARESVSQATSAAEEAYDVSVGKNAAMLAERMQRMKQKLINLHAHEFLPQEYAAAVDGIEEAQALYGRGRLAEAREEAYAALKEMSDLNDRLSERIRWVQILKRDTHQYLNQAEQLQAHVRAPQEYRKASQLYDQGVEAFQTYRLTQSEDSLGRAREAALNAIRLSKSKAAEEKKSVDKLMLEVMRELEEASGLTVVTEEGILIEPQPWAGETFIQEEEPEEAPKDSSFLPIPRDGGTAVLGNTEQENLLEQAKEIWKKGVEERNQGRYQLAAEYFQEARKLLEVYKTQAVNPVTPIYVVRLIPERRDCLWRIAEYENVYGNPYLWPKIWRRNRKLIQHPDLIYPGWKLVIPPR